jgi:S-adenosylmethionine hydrolase
MSSKIITLTTDFGTSDGYVASMKGVILSISPSCTIVDITHEIEPQQIIPASIVLHTSAKYFPHGTVHIAVVDPGVGTERAALAVKANDQYYLAPDNGLLGLIFEEHPNAEVRKIENASLYLSQVSPTFHGRDIFSPVGAHLVEGTAFEGIGSACNDCQESSFAKPLVSGNSIHGEIIYRDRFGNLITNIKQSDLCQFDPQTLSIQVGHIELQGVFNTYGDVKRGELLCLIGSSDFLEIALREGSAAGYLRYSLGTEIKIIGKG